MIVVVDDLSHQNAKSANIAWVKLEYRDMAQLMLISRQSNITMAAAGLANVRLNGVYQKLWACPPCYLSRFVELSIGLSMFVVLWDMLWTLR